MSFFAGALYIFFFKNTDLFYYFYISPTKTRCKKATQMSKKAIKSGLSNQLEKKDQKKLEIFLT
jgi:hypothetical protein